MWKSAVLGFFLLIGETFRLGASGGSPAMRERGVSGRLRYAGRPSRISGPFATRGEEGGASRGGCIHGKPLEGTCVPSMGYLLNPGLTADRGGALFRRESLPNA